MEDDGATGARTGQRGAATAGPVRPARRERLGLGVGQGVRLADHHHLPARLPARSRLLPDRRPDRRPRRPRLVADQPLPADERGPALPGAGRRDRALGDIADRAQPARSRGPKARPSRSARRSSTSAASDGTTASADAVASPGRSATGNFDAWAAGPPLPEPRANASIVYIAGSIYVIGGTDEDGAPTDTVFVLSPDSQTGALGEWTTSDILKLPEPRTQAAAAITPDGLLLVGGRNADGPVNTTWKTLLNDQGGLSAWTTEGQLVSPQADGTAILIGDYLWLFGGSDANGPVKTVQRGEFGQPAAGRAARQPRRGQADQVGGQPGRRPAGRTHERIGLGRQRRDLRGRWRRRQRSAVGGLLGRPDDRPAISPSGSIWTPATCRSTWRAPRPW